MQFIKDVLNEKVTQNKNLLESAEREIKELQEQLDYILEAKKKYQDQLNQCLLVLDKMIES